MDLTDESLDDLSRLSRFQDQCAAMVRNASLLLKYAGHAVTASNVLRVIGGAPRDEAEMEGYFWQKMAFCNRLLSQVWERSLDEGSLHRWQTLYHYWCEDWPRMEEDLRTRLTEAAYGVLGAVDLDAPALNLPPAPAQALKAKPERVPRRWLGLFSIWKSR